MCNFLFTATGMFLVDHCGGPIFYKKTEIRKYGSVFRIFVYSYENHRGYENKLSALGKRTL